MKYSVKKCCGKDPDVIYSLGFDIYESPQTYFEIHCKNCGKTVWGLKVEEAAVIRKWNIAVEPLPSPIDLEEFL